MSGFPVFKLAVFLLLAGNAVIYAGTGTGNEALDSLASFALPTIEVLARSLPQSQPSP